MPKTFLEELKRKQVEVRANGFTYRGMLLEVTAEEITLRTVTGYTSIPMDRVSSVVDPKAPRKKGPERFVDPSYFTFVDEEEPK